MNFHINKSKIFIRLDEYRLSLYNLSELTKLPYSYIKKMLEGKTKLLLPFLKISKILHLSLDEIILYK